MESVNWPSAIKPLLKKYKGTKHPLEYNNIYQLLVVVVLAARDSDKHINQLAPEFFKAYPSMDRLSKATITSIKNKLKGITNFNNKAAWLREIATTVQNNANIPLSLDALINLPGIGRKSANVILREVGASPESVMVDLHVLRVAQRLGISNQSKPDKIEVELMQLLPNKQWDAGMAMSFLGREICRPKPLCAHCLMRKACRYYQQLLSDQTK